jgi:hypothetical protein
MSLTASSLVDNKDVTLLIDLNLSAAFDMASHCTHDVRYQQYADDIQLDAACNH